MHCTPLKLDDVDVNDVDDVDYFVRVDENVDGRGDAKEEVAELDHLIFINLDFEIDLDLDLP